MSTDHTLLAEFGGHISLSRQWAYHLLGRMKFVRSKATTSKSKYFPKDFYEIKKALLNEIMTMVTRFQPQLIMNWDQTGIHLVPFQHQGGPWIRQDQEVTGVNDK